MLFIVEIVSLVDSSVRPLEDTLALHLVVFPVALVLLPVDPKYFAKTFHHIVLKVALVDRTIRPSKLPLTLLGSLKMLTTYYLPYPS